MKTVSSKVRHKGQIVDTIDIPIYETIEELQADVANDVIVDKFNKMNKIDLQAAARAPYSEKKVGKGRRMAVGFDLLTTEEIQQFVGNHAGLTKFMESPEMEARINEKLGVTDDEDGEDTGSEFDS